jgi:hypothetical protein
VECRADDSSGAPGDFSSTPPRVDRPILRRRLAPVKPVR